MKSEKILVLKGFFGHDVVRRRLLTILGKESFENILGKGENAGNRAAFSPSSQNVFYLNKFQFLTTFIVSSATALNFEYSKILSFGKGLTDKLIPRNTIYPYLTLFFTTKC